MSNKKRTIDNPDERAGEIKGINLHIREGINEWAEILQIADAEQWACYLNYFPRDIVNAVLIFQHVCSNVGIKAGRITDENVEEFGHRLRQLVTDMTGHDPADVVAQMKPNEKNKENEK